MENFDIPVTFKVRAANEKEAEDIILQHLRTAEKVIDCPDIVEYDFTEFIPSDLKNSCCC